VGHPHSLRKLGFPFVFSAASLKPPPALLLLPCPQLLAPGGQRGASSRTPLFFREEYLCWSPASLTGWFWSYMVCAVQQWETGWLPPRCGGYRTLPFSGVAATERQLPQGQPATGAKPQLSWTSSTSFHCSKYSLWYKKGQMPFLSWDKGVAFRFVLIWGVYNWWQRTYWPHWTPSCFQILVERWKGRKQRERETERGSIMLRLPRFLEPPGSLSPGPCRPITSSGPAPATPCRSGTRLPTPAPTWNYSQLESLEKKVKRAKTDINPAGCRRAGVVANASLLSRSCLRAERVRITAPSSAGAEPSRLRCQQPLEMWLPYCTLLKQ